MPKGVYPRTTKHLNKGNFKKGSIPCNYKLQTEKVLKKVEKVKLGLSVECKKHGEHLKWRFHTDNNVQCLHCASEWQMNMRRRDPLKFLLRDAKQHAKLRNREFNITLDDLKEILDQQDYRCVFTGLEFNDENPVSLDRIDSSEGYIKENVQMITIRANKMKSDMIDNDFINYCKLIVAYSESGEKKKAKARRKDYSGY